VYIHNLSLFDGIFLLGSLSELSIKDNDIQLLKRDNKLIIIRFKYGKEDDDCIEFRDSLLLLPLSLRKLAKTFNPKDKNQKDIFPYKFVDTADLNYIGRVPDFS
jgi:hypothetical protein